MAKANNKGENIALLIAILLVITTVVGIAGFGIGADQLLGIQSIDLGLDLRGGVTILYEAKIDNPTVEDMEAAQAMIQTRLDKENYTEAEVFIEGTKRLRVDIPGVEDPQQAIESIGAAAMLRFIDADGNEILTGQNIATASAQMVPNNLGVSEPAVAVTMDSEGTKKFKDYTQANLGKMMQIKLDDQVISTVMISATIIDGQGVITGGFTMEGAKQLANRIEAGSLPFALEDISSSSVGAKLGRDALNTSILAGSIGFIFILIFMVVLYRVSGVAADIALILYVALVVIILSALGATLTLPGIAGIILSIGMAVDANVIIFTRIREELVSGRSVRSAIDSGFSKAFSAILDGNMTTLIAAGVLWFMGTGLIKSFAQTLTIGIVVSMFTALVVTKTVVKCFVGMGIRKETAYATIKKSA